MPIFYRIHIDQMTGRRERPDSIAAAPQAEPSWDSQKKAGSRTLCVACCSPGRAIHLIEFPLMRTWSLLTENDEYLVRLTVMGQRYFGRLLNLSINLQSG